MIDAQSTLLDYVRPNSRSPWRWEDGGTVLAWHDGSTVAFREEVVEVLATLAPQGLPSFDGVALLLAACQGLFPHWTQIIGERPRTLPDSPGTFDQFCQDARVRLETATKEDLNELRRISAFPRHLIKPLRAKCVLAEALFENSAAQFEGAELDPEELLSPDFSIDELQTDSRTVPEFDLFRTVHALAEGLRKQTPETLELRLRTGLDELPKPLDPGLAPSDAARALLTRLLHDPEQHLMSRAAFELMAAIRLPHRLRERDESAVGGVSDLSSRGPLDRLLLSELAYDDLTLTTRIALNEALYLRRDPPEHEPASDLAILLDSGLRMWGLPRVFATAAALAMVANGSNTKQVRVWRAGRKGIVPVDLLHREGLTAHLEALEVEIHPGGSLRHFQLALQQFRPPLQSVLITQEDTLPDPLFRQLLNRYAPALSYIATVSREGRFALYAPPYVPRQPVYESQLDVHRLFSDPPPNPSAPRALSNPDLPAFLQQTPIPLRLPITGKVKHWVRDREGDYLAVMSDRRLIRYEGSRRGGEILLTKVPPGKTLWLERLDAGTYVLKAGNLQRAARLVHAAPNGPARVMELGTGMPTLAAWRTGNVLLVIGDTDVCAYSLRDGQLLDRLPNPGRWHRGRFFSSSQKFYVVNWDGANVRFDSVDFPASMSVSSVVTIFDRDGYEGPWVLNQLCQVTSLLTGERLQIPLPLGQSSHRRNVHVSRDGHRVYLTIPDLNWHQLFDLASGKGEIMRAPLDDLEALDPAPPLPSWNLLTKVEAIAASASEGLRIRNRKGVERILQLDSTGRLRFQETCSASVTTPFLGFHALSMGSPTKSGGTLEGALWPSGSRAVLDHRGLLHLRSHHTGVGEITLVLSESEVAGWTSEQIVCGNEFFLRPGQTSDPERVFKWVQKFLQNV